MDILAKQQVKQDGISEPAGAFILLPPVMHCKHLPWSFAWQFGKSHGAQKEVSGALHRCLH